MIRILEGFYSNLLNNVEGFQQLKNEPTYNILPLILAILTVHLLIAAIGKYLWNNYLVPKVTIVKPINSIIEILAISLLLRLLSN